MNQKSSRILAVDPGIKRIGIAISDETQTLARPHCVIVHKSLEKDAVQISRLAEENAVALILVGGSVGEDGLETPSTRHAQRIAAAIEEITSIPVEICDEWGTTQIAQKIGLTWDSPQNKRKGHQDAVAAGVILQSYLDEKNDSKS